MELFKTMLVLFHIYLFLLSFCLAEDTSSENGGASLIASPPSVTQTVYGFLDFTTTIGNTVMVFSPQSAATTSAKPTEPVTLIKEKPQAESTVVEILPSKAITEPLPEEVSSSGTSDASSFFLTSSGVTSSSTSVTAADDEEDDKKDATSTPTKTTSKITTISENTSTIKVKSSKATPKSLGFTGAQSKPVSKDKPKLLPLKVLNVTESPASSQVTSTTKKTVDKKTTVKVDTTTKQTPLKIKTDKANKPQIIVPANTTSKGKPTSKTEKPKTSVSPKTTNKPTSPVFVPETSPSKEGTSAPSSVLVASKVEVREGATSIQKMKKSDADIPTVQTPSSSIIEAKPITESFEQHSFTSDDIDRELNNTTEEPAAISSSGVSAPEYDFLSRQPSEVIDETFRIIDLKPNSGKYPKSKTGTSNAYRGTTPAEVYEETQPLGLITTLSDSVVRDGLTTVFETNVIGTIVSGKYAQVLQSNAHVQSNAKKIKPSSTVRILKTAAPTHKSGSNHRAPILEATPTYEEESSSVQLEVLYNGDQGAKPSRKPTLSTSTYGKNKYSSNKQNKYKDDYKDEYGTTALEEDETLDTDFTAPSGSGATSPAYQTSTSSSKKATTKKSNLSNRPPKSSNNRFQRPTTPEIATVSVYSETQASVTPSYGSTNRRFSPSNRRATSKPVTSTESEKSYTNKRSYKTKPGSPNAENNINSPVTPSSYKLKLHRPSGRWQYKTSPKPRVTIRRQDESLDNVTVSPIPQFTPDIQLEGSDQELSGSGIYPALQHEDNSIVHDVTPTLTAETLRVEISTPANFKDVYYEIATIKTPYSFQIGNVRNTRFITVTSTFERSLVQATESPTITKTEPLSENILASTHNAYDKEPPLDSSIATLPPIGLAGDAETPPLETTTESFSTTQLMLKTHILPVVRGGSDTTSYTLVQSYHVTRLVTAVKTLPPMEVYQFVPSKTLNEFNTRLDEAGSEVHLELDFGDNNEQDDEPRPNIAKALLSDLDLTNIGSNFDIADVDRNKIIEQHLRAKKAQQKTPSTTAVPSSASEAPTTPALRPEQLQQLALLRLLNPNAGLPNLVTSSRPVLKIETAYETFVLPISAGGSTFFSTISKPTATLTKTEYEYVTNTVPTLQSSVFNPLFPQQPSFQIATTPIVTQTMLTETDSKVLKLTFGAKTSYTTLFSTKVTPTILTTYLTNSIPIQPTVSPFSGFFNPSPYGFNAPFPFVG